MFTLYTLKSTVSARVSSEIASAMDLSHGARSASVRLSPLDIFALLSAA